MFWVQQVENFHIALTYVKSENNKADQFTRQSPGLEATLNQHIFLQVWNLWWPFQWDLMASAATVRKNPSGQKFIILFL